MNPPLFMVILTVCILYLAAAVAIFMLSFKPDPSREVRNIPFVSIVLTARNEENNITVLFQFHLVTMVRSVGRALIFSGNPERDLSRPPESEPG